MASVTKPKADSNYCLAELYETSQDMKGLAERLFREAAELYSHSLGMDHPQMKEAFERADAAHNNATMCNISIKLVTETEDSPTISIYPVDPFSSHSHLVMIQSKLLPSPVPQAPCNANRPLPQL